MFYILCAMFSVMAIIGISVIIKAVVCRFYSFGCKNCKLCTVIFVTQQGDAVLELKCAVLRHLWQYPKLLPTVVITPEITENQKNECIKICNYYGLKYICKGS